MAYKLGLISWGQVKPIWDTCLWPGRDSEPVTSMEYLGGYDLYLKERTPLFIGIVATDGFIMGVNSVVSTGFNQYRSRGLYVHAAYRGRGYGHKLLSHSIELCKAIGGTEVWTMPRVSAMPTYLGAGFKQTSDWMEQDYGTNCYARWTLNV